MSISKSYNKKTGTTYVYEVYENYWNKELQKQVTRRRLIGKIDPATGEVIPTRKKCLQEQPKAEKAPSEKEKTGLRLEQMIDNLNSITISLDRLSQEMNSLKSECEALLSSFEN